MSESNDSGFSFQDNRKIDPETHRVREPAAPASEDSQVSDETFDALVEKSIGELPPKIREMLEELPVLVQPLPSPEMLNDENPPLTPDLLGLFVGRHIFAQLPSAVPGAPGNILLFRRNLLRACHDLDELAQEIRITVQHEVGHLMGLDEDDLDEWGLS